MRPLGAAGFLVLVLAACRVDVAVDVLVDDDGSGSVAVVVTFDDEAVARAGGDLGAVLELDDLAAAGWTASDPEPTDAGTAVRIERPFGDLAEANAILGQLSGPDGPLTGLRLDQDTAFARTTWTFDGGIDFSAGIRAFGDEALAEVLDGEPVGLSEAELEAELGAPLADALVVAVSVRLPDDQDGDKQASWAAAYGDAPVEMHATGEQQRTSTLVAVAVSAACVVLLVGLGLVRLARRRRPDQAAHLADAERS